MKKLPIYLDYMATTPMDPRVRTAMLPYLDHEEFFGNPGSTHIYGQKARQAVEMAREEMAETINADPREIVWTSGATESNNLAIKGAAHFYKRKGKHIVTSVIEHKAVLDCMKFLETEGFEVTYLKPNKDGRFSPEQVLAALRDDTILLSLMYVNNEIGVINDVALFGEIARAKGIIFHVDAAQALGKIEVDVKAMKADLVSFSGHKIYGPKGIGALYVRRGVHLVPQIHGGGQEFGMRSGTLATHQIVGMGKAAALAKQDLKKDVEHLLELRDRLWNGLQKISEVYLNGDIKERVANNLNISFAGVDGETLFLALSDIAVSAGAACSVASVTPSHVLKAIGVSQQLAQGSVRFSLGRFTKKKDIEHTIKHVIKVVTAIRGN